MFYIGQEDHPEKLASALSVHESTNTALFDCVFENNSGNAAALVAQDPTSLTIRGGLFQANNSSKNGGALAIFDPKAGCEISDAVFFNNFVLSLSLAFSVPLFRSLSVYC